MDDMVMVEHKNLQLIKKIYYLNRLIYTLPGLPENKQTNKTN